MEQQQQQPDAEQQSTVQARLIEQLEVLCLTVKQTAWNALHDVSNFCRVVTAFPQLRPALLAAAVGKLHYRHSCSGLPCPAQRRWLTKHKQLLRRFSIHMQPLKEPTVLQDCYQVLVDLMRSMVQDGNSEAAQPGTWAISECETPWGKCSKCFSSATRFSKQRQVS